MTAVDIPTIFDLKGKVALVTGGSKGIGFSTCQHLAAAGAAVVLTGRGQPALDAAVASLREAGATVLGIQGDIGDADHREDTCRRCVDELGGLDILVNNAADGGPIGKLVELAPEAISEVMRADQLTPLLWAQAAWRAAMRDRGGAIVNISSFAGLRPRSPHGAYGSAKAGMDHITRILALELAPGVRVNSVAPGLVLTEMARANASEALWKIAEQRPMKRHGNPEDIARAILFLVSDAASWITGHVLPVEGGALLV